MGYTRQNIGANGDPQDGDYGTDVLHIPGTNGVGPNYEGIPGFQIASIANIGNTNTGSPFQFRDNQYTTNINVTKIKGPHNIRAGFEYDKFALNHFQPQGGTFGTARGTFGFDGSLTALKGGTAINAVHRGAPALQPRQLLGAVPARISFRDRQGHAGTTIRSRCAFPLGRSMCAMRGRSPRNSPSITACVGNTTRSTRTIITARFASIPTTDNIYVGGEGGVPWDTGATASKKDFAPRLGMAYRLDEKTVIRGGYGITVDPDNMRNQRNQYPAIVNQVYQPLNTYQFISYAGVPNSDGSPRVSLSDGIPLPTFPNITVGIIKPSPTASLTTYLPSISTVTFPANFDRGYYQSWNSFVQHEFSSTLMAQVGYVGTHGVHTNMGVNINGSAPGTGTAGRQLYPYVTSDMNSYEPFGDNDLQRLAGHGQKAHRHIDDRRQLHVLEGNQQHQRRQRRCHACGAPTRSLSRWTSRSPASTAPQNFQLYWVYRLAVRQGTYHVESRARRPGSSATGRSAARFRRESGLPFGIGTTSTINAGGQADSATQINPNVQILGGHDADDPYFNGAAFTNPPANVLGSTGHYMAACLDPASSR